MEWQNNPELYPPYLRSRVKRHWGIGAGKAYRPYIELRDGGQGGTTGVVSGLKTGRRHLLPSVAARAFYFMCERQEDVIDIRESFPILDIESTLKLCSKLGVEHPYDKIHPKPLLVDFMITRQVKDGQIYEARSLGSLEDSLANAPRSQFDVLHAWFGKRGVEWKIVEKENLTKTCLASLRFVRMWVVQRYKPDEQALDAFTKAFRRHYKHLLSLEEIVELCGVSVHQKHNRCLNHFRFAAWTGRIPVDMRYPLREDKPVALLEER